MKIALGDPPVNPEDCSCPQVGNGRGLNPLCVVHGTKAMAKRRENYTGKGK